MTVEGQGKWKDLVWIMFKINCIHGQNCQKKILKN